MPFKKGKSGNPAGRPQGALNKSHQELKDLIQGDVDWKKAIKKLEALMLKGNVNAARILFEYGYGRPLNIEVSRRDDPATIEVVNPQKTSKTGDEFPEEVLLIGRVLHRLEWDLKKAHLENMKFEIHDWYLKDPQGWDARIKEPYSAPTDEGALKCFAHTLGSAMGGKGLGKSKDGPETLPPD